MRISTKLIALTVSLLLSVPIGYGADHNDPNGVNSIFSDMDVHPADLYGMFGYPSDDRSQGEKVIVMLTFASSPGTGVFDPDVQYIINFDPDPRTEIPMIDQSWKEMHNYIDAYKDKYFRQRPSQIRVEFTDDNMAKVHFLGFPEGDFSRLVPTNQNHEISSQQGEQIKAYIGGRDDPFFNDLPGFFRSINYGPQFYDIPLSMAKDYREFPIPKTLLELEGNTLFNYDPNQPDHGRPGGVKYELKSDPDNWDGNRFLQDENGNYRMVYSGRDAQKGIDVNAIVFEVPLEFLTRDTERDRIVRIWGESWVLKASGKIILTEDEKPGFWGSIGNFFGSIFTWFGNLFSGPEVVFVDNLEDYKMVDQVGVPFSDAALNEREDARIGHNNIRYSLRFLKRFAHLGWGFGPSISALGLGTCFDHDNSPVSIHRTYKLASVAFPRVKDCIFQKVYMPDSSWNVSGKDIPIKRVFEIIIPNVTSIDMDTNGTWPYGRRPEDQVASRFLSVFLDMETGCNGGPCNVETLSDMELWDAAPIYPKNPPNPLKNDKPFLKEFPYLAEPWKPYEYEPNAEISFLD